MMNRIRVRLPHHQLQTRLIQTNNSSIPERLTWLSTRSPDSIRRTLTQPWPLVSIQLDSNSSGYGLFATRDIKAGELLWQEAPVISIPLTLSSAVEAAEDEQMEAEATDDTDHTNQSQGNIPSSTQLFCHYCHSLIVPPFRAAAASDASSGQSRSNDQHQQLSHPPVQYACRTTHPSFKRVESLGSDSIPCEVEYCSHSCEDAAWLEYHQKEHMKPNEIEPFLSPDLIDIYQEPELKELVGLLLRIIAQLRSPLKLSHDPSDLTLLDHLSHLTSPDTVLSHLFTPSTLRALEHAVDGLLPDLFQLHPHLQEHLNELSDADSHKGHFIRALLAALATNSFQLIRARPTLISSPTHAPPKLEYPRYDESDLYSSDLSQHFTSYAVFFSLASYMNHACSPYHNVAILPDGEQSHQLQSSTAASTSTSSPRQMQPTSFVALRDIRPREELFWSYTYDPSELPRRYAFTCQCPVCSQRRRQQPRRQTTNS